MGIFVNSVGKFFVMMLDLKVGTQYTVQLIQMECGHNGKGCFFLPLTNMPPLRTMKKKRMHDRDILKIDIRYSKN